MSSGVRYGRWAALSIAVLLAACGEGSEDETADVAAAADARAANVAPSISGVPATAIAPGASYTFAPTATDGDGDALKFGISSMPAWASFDTASGRLAGTPRTADVGTYRNIRIWVSDGDEESVLPAFDVVVDSAAPANRAPAISGTPEMSATVGSAYSFTPTASDADGNELTFTIRNRPVWATFNTSTGRLQGTPQAVHEGTFANIAITVSDGQETATLPAFTIVVTPSATNSAPVISGTPPTSVEAGESYSFTPTASDTNGDVLVFSASGVPSWAGLDSQTGRIAGTPPSSLTGTTADIVIRVSDGKATATLPAFRITVKAPTANDAPTIGGTPSRSATEGTQYVFQPTAADADGDTLTFTIANRPTWATFNSNTGRLQGTPGASHVRSYDNIVISVSDGKASTSLPAFSIAVEGANEAPTITGTPATTATVGTQYSFTPSANDEDGDTLTFSITNKPVWATFNASNGRLSGTPAAGNVGTVSNIVIRVSDGKKSAQLAAFSIAVSGAANKAPTISGTPSTTVTTGAAYSFQPTANDGDGDTLTFSIDNKPSWASFDSATGRLHGTPDAGDVGTTTGIVIRVTDGDESKALAAFSITVQAFATGSATLTWSPPTQNTDGSALMNLAGYKIYWGSSAGTYTRSVTLNNPGLSSYVVTNLSAGTYYFVATALNSDGVESAFSGAASKTIR
jgi:hypothetical protein